MLVQHLKWVSIIFAGSGLLFSCSGSRDADDPPKLKALATETIKIGEIVSLTGSEATFGLSARNGIQIALDRVNKSGGIGGRPIELFVMDDGGVPEQAAQAAEKLIQEQKAVALLAGVASSLSLAMAPVAQKHQVPMISPSSTHPRVTEFGDYIFRACYIDPFQGPAMAKFAMTNLKTKRAAILRDTRNEYSVGLANFFREQFLAMGGKVVVEQTYLAGDVEFKKQLTAIRNAKPDFVYVPGYYREASLILQQARAMKLQQTFAGGDGWDSDQLYAGAGDALNGAYFSTHYSPDGTDPVLRQFVSEYKARFKAIPDALAALGYDAALVLIDSLKRTRSLQGSDLRDAISQTKDVVGATGKITLDSKRNAVKSAVILKIVDHHTKYAETIAPS